LKVFYVLGTVETVDETGVIPGIIIEISYTEEAGM
jgi:hypothetical protein